MIWDGFLVVLIVVVIVASMVFLYFVDVYLVFNPGFECASGFQIHKDIFGVLLDFVFLFAFWGLCLFFLGFWKANPSSVA